MISEQNMGKWAERFLKNELNQEELNLLDSYCSANASFKDSWEEMIQMMLLIEQHGERTRMKQKIASLHPFTAENLPQKSKSFDSVHLFRKYAVKIGVAAALILASSLSTYFFLDTKSEKTGAQYMLLRREIETIKKSQTKLMDSIKVKSYEIEEEAGPLYGGTGFAVSNDGFVATNYHVVKDANSIFIQTAAGQTLKAYLVAFEPIADVALLKIENSDFRFAKTGLPYSFASTPSGLGQKVFTIGYPQDDLVYNEGYISCEAGFERDSNSYQLEMTANPGQSGAPVLDKNGNVIALITGKQSNTAGKLFAVRSQALISLIQSLPAETNLKVENSNKLRNLDRTQQVSKLRDYVCAVKVN